MPAILSVSFQRSPANHFYSLVRPVMPDARSTPALSAPEAHSGRETIVVLCVLVSLAVIASGIAIVQSRYNPAVINFLQGTAD
ncbi:MAG: hypothetical protein HY895_02800, partial [Deltaproteobacteria bacterium]|nr:hypothetical protein [Deltaproteobacteria bacterium]